MGMQEIRENLLEAESNFTKPDDRYHTLFERVNAAVFLTSFEGQIQEANQKSCEFLGYDWVELLRLTLQDVLSKEFDWKQYLDELVACGNLTFESETVCKNGDHLPVDVNISIFRLNDKLALLVFLRDITQRKNQEKKLKESEKKYHGLFEYSTDGIFVLDGHGDILDINTRMCEILDVMKSSVMNKNLFSMDLLTAKSLPVVIEQFEQLLSEKIAASFTTEIENRKGRILDVEISSFFLVKKDNQVDNFILIVRDITSRNEAELKRAREHELLKTLMDNIPDSVYFKDNQNRFVLVNKAKAAHSNVTPEVMIGKTDFDFFPPEQAQRILDDDNAIICSGQRIINKLECLVRNDGSKQLVSETKIPRYSEDGDIIGTMGITRDVTDRKHAEDELARNLEMLQTLMDSISDSVYFKDIQNRFERVNKAKAAYWNVRPGAMIGKTDFDFLPIDQAQKAFDEDNKILQTGQTIINDIEKITDSNGSEQWYSVTKVPRYDLEGRIIGTLGISRNITEWKKLQEIKQ